MPAIDTCEPAIIRALEKDGWQLIKRSVAIRLGHRYVIADFSMQKAAQQLLIIEAKCFPDQQAELHDLYTAIGQYILYRNGLSLSNRPEVIYLAVPYDIYDRLFLLEPVQKAVNEIKIKIVVIDIQAEEITAWIH